MGIESTLLIDAALDARTPEFDNGYLRIYDGSQPADPSVAITTQVLLAELRFNATAFGASSGGVATANDFTADAAANATGTASWFRALKSDGTTALYDGTVSDSVGDLVIDSTSIFIGNGVDVTAMTLTQPAS